jgi:hypothetical protein
VDLDIGVTLFSRLGAHSKRLLLLGGKFFFAEKR